MKAYRATFPDGRKSMKKQPLIEEVEVYRFTTPTGSSRPRVYLSGNVSDWVWKEGVKHFYSIGKAACIAWLKNAAIKKIDQAASAYMLACDQFIEIQDLEEQERGES